MDGSSTAAAAVSVTVISTTRAVGQLAYNIVVTDKQDLDASKREGHCQASRHNHSQVGVHTQARTVRGRADDFIRLSAECVWPMRIEGERMNSGAQHFACKLKFKIEINARAGLNGNSIWSIYPLV